MAVSTRTSFNVQEVTLKNGEKVQINDHVYSAAPWDRRDPVPYSIGRIIEFLPPESATTNKPKLSNNNTLRARLAWYYRPVDVSDRGNGDNRLLLAALFSEVVPVTHLRGKCIVRHKDKISDLSTYKRKEDRFWYSQLFDPFTKENYEVILASEIRNLPSHIKEVLCSRFEFVVCEKEALADLQDSLRLCETCGDWCPGPESVICELCKKHYHMHCVTPPLMSKPSRGYGWSCASCNNRGNDPENDGGATGKRATGGVVAKNKPKAKSATPKFTEEDPDKYWKGWSFRYFGQYTVAEDTLDPDDMIYVRAPTRVGRQFQAVLPNLGDPTPVDENGDQRGGDTPDPELTLELMSNVVDMPPDLVTQVEKRISVLTPRQDLRMSVDWLEEVIRRLSQAYSEKRSFYSVNMKEPRRHRKWKSGEERYTDREWNEEEMNIFDESVRRHASDLRMVKQDIKTRRIDEIVRYFGKWKNVQLKKENQLILSGQTYGNEVTTGDEDDNTSVYNWNDRRTWTCGICRTKESKEWWKAPKGLGGGVMCEECGMAWRKYNIKSIKGTERDKDAIVNREKEKEKEHQTTPERERPPVTRSAKALAEAPAQPNSRAERAERREAANPLGATNGKREGSPLTLPPSKRQKSVNGAPAPLPKLTCLLCKKTGLQGAVVKCSKCRFTIHSGCIGVLPSEANADWMCEICANEKSLESNLDTACALCPPNPAERKRGAKDSSFFRAAKPTENRGWVHVLCSTFNPYLDYTDSKRMRLVEGISTMPKKMLTTPCKLCNGSQGVVAKCENCAAFFHPVCAWNSGYKFGLEVQPVKSHQKREWPYIEWRGELGHLNPVIICDTHSTFNKRILDLCDMDENGKTALEYYNEAYKQAPDADKTYGLLRKARRLDEAVKGPRFDAIPVLDPIKALPLEHYCVKCFTRHAPFWWPVPEGEPVPMLVDPPPSVNQKLNHTNGIAQDETTISLSTTPVAVEGQDVVMAPPQSNGVDHHSTSPNGTIKEEEEPALPPKPAYCHSCYHTMHADEPHSLVIDVSAPIAVLE